jgi:hypothetical protein
MTNQHLVNTRQSSINKRHTNINDSQGILNEDTRVDLKVNNLWAILVSVIISTISIIFFVYKPQMELKASLDLLNQKVDTFIEQGKINKTSIQDLQVKYNGVSVDIATCCK